MKFFKKNSELAIDLGTTNSLVYVKEKGIVFREPTVVCYNTELDQVESVGEEARKMIGRTPGNMIAVRPIKDGVVAEFDRTCELLRYLVKKSVAKTAFTNPRAIVSHPAGVTQVERSALMRAVEESVGEDVLLMESALCAAMGAGLPVFDPLGTMVVDLGGGTTEVAVISLGGIVISRSLRIGGEELDEAIISYVRKQYNLLIGERTAEDIKINLGTAYKFEEEEDDHNYTELDYEKSMKVKGRDLDTGLPKDITVTEGDVAKALEYPVSTIVEAIVTTLEKTPPELSADIMDRGITITGGGALLRGIDTLISKETKMPVFIADHPLDCVVVGAGIALNRFDDLVRNLK
ncbi:rod shape-determining protein [Proteiniclasticum sp. QWL-01]|uniref:rod shape-determining protein n=1 Tax=Proteiniclasticum sp. QWL-01 TaxID=3036945 RepID=UPI0021FF8403|nr:rod shape-determining protein [Proteiniclasticum sp. QWL-01]UUM13180.1 rod shape-determining protein [Clostridiaceae bacterium HFYG-1003]WFF71606.1 rod shape-determining protein [Proteiniclasticum sp. QWL-01]